MMKPTTSESKAKQKLFPLGIVHMVRFFDSYNHGRTIPSETLQFFAEAFRSAVDEPTPDGVYKALSLEKKPGRPSKKPLHLEISKFIVREKRNGIRGDKLWNSAHRVFFRDQKYMENLYYKYKNEATKIVVREDEFEEMWLKATRSKLYKDDAERRSNRVF